jgi:NAD(P)H-hydrate epimerase
MGQMLRLTRERVRNIDRLSVEKYHIPGAVLMENAAIAASNLAVKMSAPGQGPVMIVCGGGNNGGDGLTIARHLHNRGYDVRIFLTTDPEKYAGEAKINWEIVQAMKLPIDSRDLKNIGACRPALILDAIFGTGLTQPPRDPFDSIVAEIEANGAPVLAIDIPSGLDCDTGKPLGKKCVRAKRTITFVAEKAGFARPEAREFLGEVIVGDIGCPRELIDDQAKR